MIKLTIGITVFNRRKTLERMIKSLFASDLDVKGIEYTIRVFDDCSEEYTESDVRAMFPIEIDYYRHNKNHGADYNMGYMYRTFLNKDDDILFNCDSDLIFDRNWLNALIYYFPQTDGILSLFNTNKHKIRKEAGELCIKDSVGNAGTVMNRSSVELICSSINESESYTLLDHNWNRLFRKHGKQICCTSRSYVQHIGIDGFNSTQGAMDIGESFVVNNETNGQILGDVLKEIVSQKKEDAVKKRSIYYLFPFDKILPGKKVVIYGAGVVGNDYRNQIEICEYCSSFIQVDRNYKKLSGVEDPKVLGDVECDYILVAAHFATIREEMKADILRIDSRLSDKIISDVCYSIKI